MIKPLENTLYHHYGAYYRKGNVFLNDFFLLFFFIVSKNASSCSNV